MKSSSQLKNSIYNRLRECYVGTENAESILARGVIAVRLAEDKRFLKGEIILICKEEKVTLHSKTELYTNVLKQLYEKI